MELAKASGVFNGERNSQSKLTVEKVRLLRFLYQDNAGPGSGYSPKALAIMFGVTRWDIYHILR
jgi:hypothetical protein